MKRTLRLLAVLLALAWPGAASVGAEEEAPSPPALAIEPSPAVDWEQTTIVEPVIRLFTPWSGALFGQTREGLYRSDDAGVTWYAITLPPHVTESTLREGIAVDPNNHTILFVASRQGIYRSVDDGASWQLVLPTDEGRGFPIALSVSEADGRIVYVATSFGEFSRSADRGDTWDRRSPGPQGGPCAWSAGVLRPHPTEPSTLFTSYGCYAGRNLGGGIALRRSNSQDGTSSVFHVRSGTSPTMLTGGQGALPERYYLGLIFPVSTRGSALMRTDSGGAAWVEVLATDPADEFASDGNTPFLGGVAYDLAQPDRVWVGKSGGATGVLASADAGTTWLELGRQDIGRVSDLALGIDAGWLFAATDQGVWRYRLLP